MDICTPTPPPPDPAQPPAPTPIASTLTLPVAIVCRPPRASLCHGRAADDVLSSGELPTGNLRHTSMAAVVAPTRAEVMSLFRSLLRTAKQFSDYNIREYTRRRAADAFHENRALTDAPAAAAAFAEGKKQLEVARRQVVVYCFYAPKAKSVMELKVQ